MPPPLLSRRARFTPWEEIGGLMILAGFVILLLVLLSAPRAAPPAAAPPLGASTLKFPDATGRLRTVFLSPDPLGWRDRVDSAAVK